jgi:hypothetical protein
MEKHEVKQCRLHPHEWLVEHIDNDGAVHMARFSGPQAEKRARQYARAMNQPLVFGCATP